MKSRVLYLNFPVPRATFTYLLPTETPISLQTHSVCNIQGQEGRAEGWAGTEKQLLTSSNGGA